jgi:hypothetical protein
VDCPDAGVADMQPDTLPDKGPEPPLKKLVGVYGILDYETLTKEDPSLAMTGYSAWIEPLSQQDSDLSAVMLKQDFPVVLDGWGKLCAKYKVLEPLHYAKDGKEAWDVITTTVTFDGSLVDKNNNFSLDIEEKTVYPDGPATSESLIWYGMHLTLSKDQLSWVHYGNPFGMWLEALSLAATTYPLFSWRTVRTSSPSQTTLPFFQLTASSPLATISSSSSLISRAMTPRHTFSTSTSHVPALLTQN